MIEWLLIFQIFGANPAPSQIGPFKSEAACLAAGEHAAKILVGGKKWLCVPTELPTKS